MTRMTLVKGLALCSSILLAGGFVAYRQKQASAPAKSETPTMPGSKSPGATTVFPSSKSIDVILSNPNQQKTSGDFGTPTDPQEAGKVLLPSSKHIEMPVFKRRVEPSRQSESRTGEDVTAPSAGEEKPAESSEGKTLLPSSKIGAILTPKDVPVEEAVPVPDAGRKGDP